MGDIIDSTYLQSAFDIRSIQKLVDDGSGPKQSVIDDAIAAAESEVYNDLSKQYLITDLAANAGIKRAVAVVTMYILEIRRRDVSKGISAAYMNAKAYIRNLAEGASKLSNVTQLLPRVTNTNAQQVFENGYFDGLPNAGDPSDVGPSSTEI